MAALDPPSGETAPFAGTDRYEVVRRLGAGGYGVVYEALDRATGERVALKTLRGDNPEALYRLKREFRALADVRHDNLVRLHDLVGEPQWFITMELVDGVDFLHAVVDVPASVTETMVAPIDSLGHTVRVAPGALVALARAVPTLRRTPAAAARLRPALRQLAHGLVALHRRGMLHRDIKPSNVLVTTGGRVVILDFGLVQELGPGPVGEVEVAGTIEYMAPEQAAGAPATAACDWYSVGVMLFEALTGQLPYSGAPLEVLGQKLEVDAPEVRRLAPDAPADLAALCMALLARDPDERPDDDEILAILGGGAADTFVGTIRPTLVDAARPFVGRARELAALLDAAATARTGRVSVALVRGRPGLGKTALLDRLVERLAGAVVLGSRCHERERVPYKAIDGLVDGLARVLRDRDDAFVAGLCPPHVHTLARLFPVLRRVPAIDRAPPVDVAGLAPHELRRAAFAALRQILHGLARPPAAARPGDAEPRPADPAADQQNRAYAAGHTASASAEQQTRAFLPGPSPSSSDPQTRAYPPGPPSSSSGPQTRVYAAGHPASAPAEAHAAPTPDPPTPAALVALVLDDFHWGDVDSVALLRDVLHPPDPPPLLLVVAYHSDQEAPPCVHALMATLALHPRLPRRDLELAPLTADDAHTLARALLGSRAAEADAVVRQADGNPLQIAELCHFVRAAGALGEAPSFDAILRARLAAQSPAARTLVAVVALATQPIDPALAAAVAASQVDIPDLPAVLLGLRREHLVRGHTAHGNTTLEVFHDRVRAAVLDTQSPAEQRAIHLAFAVALERVDDPDEEVLSFHLEAAGEPARAATHALRAAARARDALAFDRAAALYRRARLHAAADQRPIIDSLLGDVLASDGRGGEAADAYELAADALPPGSEQALELLRKAGFERLRSGQIDAGLAVLHKVLSGTDLRLAPTRASALLALLGHRLALRLRGLRFRERAEPEIPPDLLRRADVAWSVGASGLGMVDDLAAGEFQSLALRLALEAGEPRRVCRALAGEVAFSAVAGSRSQRRTARLLHTARTLAERLGDPQARGTVAMTAGVAAYLEGRFRDARTACTGADQLLRGCADAAWDRTNAALFGLQAGIYLGELAQVGAEIVPLLRDAEARGNLYLQASLRCSPTHLVWLAQDDVAAAQAGVDDVVRRWSTRGVQVQHYWQIHARCDFDLYRGDPRAALARIEARWGDLSALLRIQFVRIEALHLRGRCRLAAGDLALLPRVLADARAIEAQRTPWGDALAQLLRAGVAARRRDRPAAIAHLAEATAGFDPAHMALHAAAARRRRGELSEGTDAGALRDRADVWLADQNVRDVPRLLATLAPGFG